MQFYIIMEITKRESHSIINTDDTRYNKIQKILVEKKLAALNVKNLYFIVVSAISLYINFMVIN